MLVNCVEKRSVDIFATVMASAMDLTNVQNDLEISLKSAIVIPRDRERMG